MNKFDKNTSLFIIRDYFNNLTNYNTELDYIEWLKVGNVGKITFYMNPMKLLKELLSYMNLQYVDDYYDLFIVKKIETVTYTKIRKKIKKSVKNIHLLRIILHKPENSKEYFIIYVNDKDSFDIAEKIAIEIVNYIGLDCKIEY
jgi:hypothetical protein